MSTVENINPEEEPVPKPWVPRVITGGKGPPEPPSAGNWLSALRPGHTFVCRQSEKSVDYELFHVVFVKENMYLLKWVLPDGKLWDKYVDSKLFSNHYRDHKVMGFIDLTEEAGDDNEHDFGQGDRPDRSRDLVLHEAVQGVDQLPHPAGDEEPDLPDGDQR